MLHLVWRKAVVVYQRWRVAGRFPMPTLPWREIVAGAERPSGVCWLWVPDVRDGGDDFPRYGDSVGCMVSGDVVGDHTEERSQRAGTAAGVGLEELRDRVDVVA